MKNEYLATEDNCELYLWLPLIIKNNVYYNKMCTLETLENTSNL